MQAVAPAAPAASLRCAQCGYDLRAHDTQASCPECGCSVQKSAEWASTHDSKSERKWRWKLRVGTLFLLAAGIISQLPVVLEAVIVGLSNSKSLLVYLLPFPFAMTGIFLMTASHRREPWRSRMSVLVARFALLLWIPVVSYLVADGYSDHFSNWMSGTLGDGVANTLLKFSLYAELALPVIAGFALYRRLASIALQQKRRSLCLVTRGFTWFLCAAAILPWIPDDLGPPPRWFSDQVPAIGCRGWGLVLAVQLVARHEGQDAFEIGDADGYWPVPAAMCPSISLILLTWVACCFRRSAAKQPPHRTRGILPV